MLAGWLGTWGAKVDREVRVRALAAAGVLTAAGRSATDAPSFGEDLAPWSWPELTAFADVAALAEAWDRARAGRPVRISIERKGEPHAGAAFEVHELLSGDGVVGDGAAHIATAPGAPSVPWQWPLDVAVVPGPAGDRVFEHLGQAHFRDTLARVRRLGERNWRASVLVLAGSLADASAEVLRLHRSVRAAAVIVLGRAASTSERTAAMFALIASLTHARAVVARAAMSDWPAFLDSLVAELSHDAPLDVALTRAGRNPNGRRPIIAGDAELFRTTRLSGRLVGSVRDLGEVMPTFPPGVGGLESLSGLEIYQADRGLGDAIAEAMPPGGWEHESNAASGLAKIEQLVDRAADDAPPRWLLARMADGTGQSVERAERARSYQLEVKVGAQDVAFFALSQPVPDLPHSDRAERLMVVVTEPALAPTPLVGWIELPPVGTSTLASFPIRTSADTLRIEARISLFHDGRLLQTGVLHGECDGRTPLAFELEVVARAHLAGFEARQNFGASIVANHTTDGTARFLAANAEGRAATLAVSAGDIESLTRALGLGFDLANDDPRPQRTLRDASSVDALRHLARHGAAFHESLVDDNELGPALLRDDPIQIVAARPNTFLPVELAYRFPVPSQAAPLCDHAEDGLAAGQCPRSCGGGTADRLCPLGFWSLSRVIERCVYQVADRKIVGDFGISVEPLRGRSALARPARAVLAAADRAKRRVPTCIDDLAAALAESFGGPAPVPVTTWAAWQEVVSADPWPALLVLVPHHAQEAGSEILEIGSAQKLASLDVGALHVIGARAPDTTPRPIVLLAGCETHLADISYESFVSVFRKRGAAVVIGTIATVLGLDAAPVTAELAAELAASFGQAPPRTLGEAILRVRRRLVAKGRVMVLALAAYGDADWQLT